MNSISFWVDMIEIHESHLVGLDSLDEIYVIECLILHCRVRIKRIMSNITPSTVDGAECIKLIGTL